MDDFGSSSNDSGSSSLDASSFSALDRLQSASASADARANAPSRPKMTIARKISDAPYKRMGDIQLKREDHEQSLRDLSFQEQSGSNGELRNDQLGAYMKATAQGAEMKLAEMKSQAARAPQRKPRIIPLWRYLSYAAPAGMQLNPERARSRDYLIDNAFGLVFSVLRAAFTGWCLSLLVKFVGGMFVDFPAIVEDHLWKAFAVLIYWRHQKDDMHLDARRLGGNESRYIPLPDAPAQISADRPYLNLRVLEVLADTTPSEELREALIDMEQVLHRWSHRSNAGSANKRHEHMIRTIVDACENMSSDRDLMNSDVGQAELLETLRSAQSRLSEVIRKDAERKSSEFGISMRTLRSQMGLGRKDQ